jgi:hypothetical protein
MLVKTPTTDTAVPISTPDPSNPANSITPLHAVGERVRIATLLDHPPCLKVRVGELGTVVDCDPHTGEAFVRLDLYHPEIPTSARNRVQTYPCDIRSMSVWWSPIKAGDHIPASPQAAILIEYKKWRVANLRNELEQALEDLRAFEEGGDADKDDPIWLFLEEMVPRTACVECERALSSMLPPTAYTADRMMEVAVAGLKQIEEIYEEGEPALGFVVGIFGIIHNVERARRDGFGPTFEDGMRVKVIRSNKDIEPGTFGTVSRVDHESEELCVDLDPQRLFGHFQILNFSDVEIVAAS